MLLVKTLFVKWVISNHTINMSIFRILTFPATISLLVKTLSWKIFWQSRLWMFVIQNVPQYRCFLWQLKHKDNNECLSFYSLKLLRIFEKKLWRQLEYKNKKLKVWMVIFLQIWWALQLFRLWYLAFFLLVFVYSTMFQPNKAFFVTS